MNVNDYQEFVVSKMNMQLNEKLEIASLALGCAGEAGEISDHVKKYISHGHELNKEYLIKELGDVLWYIAALSNHLDVKMSDVISQNIEKLNARYPNGFSEEASKNRKDK